MKRITVLCTMIFILTQVTKVFSQENVITVTDATTYFKLRNEAISLVKNEEWKTAIPILENLTKQYLNDADLFYILGLAYYETAQYPKSIVALKKTLASGGTILRGIPTGSAPSNDIMIKIGKAYGKSGDKKNALLWLQKGFIARYDEKPFVKGSSAFKKFYEDADFKQLFGDNNNENKSRVQSWVGDLSYLESRINELHYSPNHAISKVDLSKAIHLIKTNIASLSDEQITVEIMKVIGGLGNGHNLIIPTTPKIGALKKLPVQFYQFSDGMFIVDAEEGYKKYIGYKVTAIAQTPIAEALRKTNEVNARDNKMQTLWLGPYYLGLPDVLEGLKIIKNAQEVTITIKENSGKPKKITMNPITWSFSDFPKMVKNIGERQPMFLSNMNDPYWYKMIDENEAIYIQFNAVRNKEEQSLQAFNVELREQIRSNKIQNLILDLRHNHGGNGSILPPMLKTIINFEVMNPKGKVFVLMGRETFSAAQNLLTDITKYTNPILIGEPSGSKPNHIGEAGWFKLPNSGLMGLVSTQFHQTSKAEDNRKWIAPHIPVDLSSTDYFRGKDKVLNTVFELIND